MTSRSQRSSGSPSPWPRNSTIGACEWALTRPGVSTPGSATTSASPARRRLGGRADPRDPAVVDVQHGIGDDGAGPVPDDDGPGGEALSAWTAEPSAALAARARRLPGPADTVEAMSLLAAAASDEGGHHRLPARPGRHAGPGRRRAEPSCWRRSSRRSPARRCSALAGVLINSGRWASSRWSLFATLGSVLGAIFFYYVGRALGPRRSHAFLDRLPLVETEDVDKTFEWFERHGRSAVFFGRMVPIVRSFISVPAGVVRMPLGQFLLFTDRRQPDLEQRADRPGRGGGRLHPGQPEVPRLRGGRGRRPRRRLDGLQAGEDVPPAPPGARRPGARPGGRRPRPGA